MNMFLHKILFLIISITILCACNRSSTPRVSSVIQDKSCFAPCWEQITPGKTTRKEVKSLLAAIPWVDKGTIEDTYTLNPGDSIKWMGSTSAADYSGRVFFNNNLVTLVLISPNIGVLKFADLIAKLGEPEGVLAYLNRAERLTIVVYILYPTKGYAFLDYYYSSFTKPEITVQVNPKEDVKQIWYGETKNYNNFFIYGQIDRLPVQFLQQSIQKWNGFGKYNYVELNSSLDKK